MRLSSKRGFSLVEVLVATTILIAILGIVFSMTRMISQTWGRSTAKIAAFQGARAAFGAMSSQLSQATLNTYYDYFDSLGNSRAAALQAGATNFIPVRYGRYSDLHFVCGKSLVTGQIGHSLFFQAPVGYTDDKISYGGMDTLLNGCGYYVVYDKDNSLPAFLGGLPNKPPERYRFRLMQYLQPAQGLKIYDAAAATNRAWFQTPLAQASPPVGILTENVVAVVLLPKLSKADQEAAKAAGSSYLLAPGFEYDSRKSTPEGMTDHQLPPVVELVLVAIDEASAQRVCTGAAVPDLGVQGGVASLFQDVDKLEADLTTLTGALIEKRLTYRVFRSEIALRGAKWSAFQ